MLPARGLRLATAASPLVFVIGAKKKHRVELTNGEEIAVVFKVQCTESSRFRLQPSKGVVAANASVAVHIQLASHSMDEANCTFLVLSKAASSPDAIASGAWVKDDDVAKLYVNAEIRQEASNGGDVAPLPETEQPTSPDERRVVRLLVKNKSRKSSNRLSDDEVAYLRQCKAAVTPSRWHQWEMNALHARTSLQGEKKRRASSNASSSSASLALHEDDVASLLTSPRYGKSAHSVVTESEQASLCCEPVDSVDAEVYAPLLNVVPHRCRRQSACDDQGRSCMEPACLWARYMLDVCIQQLQHTVNVGRTIASSSDDASSAIARISKSAQEIVILHQTNPYFDDAFRADASTSRPWLGSTES
ncbi:hypothetical protein SPRG_10283 [Saprolegnia parasitica CBS 223.65]|uniref:MSP domain-containing protein n=1 Tax=Saprolegnia parasitica (strain CBS 223.65) TaxID=695850 RepID=A0A067CCB7_SAPPC|nr:hypothetical protein SPRG_10283 [Saprolegnia parasitica CBS 223.65]KDO24467.1 hypothetical protein SPRG_10283 [Saprolegnia parasitica CBS 223.65]|eukprot:XP_012204733.1 hypothetical protein SPRG_10283 [Saprolegnia parasitica CBS 223.65]